MPVVWAISLSLFVHFSMKIPDTVLVKERRVVQGEMNLKIKFRRMSVGLNGFNGCEIIVFVGFLIG